MTKLYQYCLLLGLTAACATSSVPTMVHSEPEWSNIEEADGLKRIVLTSTNFFSGSIDPSMEDFKNGGLISVGGSDTLKKYLRILRDRYEDQVLLVDSGEITKPNSSKKELKNTLAHYKALNFDAIQFSEKEYASIDGKLVDSYRTNFVNTNVINLKSQGPYRSKYISPQVIKKVNGVKVGIMAISTYKNIDARKNDSLKGLYFEDPVFSILKSQKKLKRKGAKVFVLLVHTHENCKESNCNDSIQSVEKIIKRLPPGSVDAIVGSAPIMLNRSISGVPVIQNLGKGKYISRMELFYNKSKRSIEKERTIIHRPTKLCTRFFKATQDCHIENDEFSKNKLNLIENSDYSKTSAKFLGKSI